MKYSVGFIGVGNMAQALLASLNGKIDKNAIFLYDIDTLKRDKMRNEGFTFVKSEADVVRFADIVFLTVKPNNLKKVLERIAPAVTMKNVLVSVAAGISINYIKSIIGKECKVVRAMPNTPISLGKGATAISYSMPITYNEFNTIREIFSSAGLVEILPEEKMNEVVSVNGSGPAYIYMLYKAMVDGAIAQGIDKNAAERLVLDTIKGSVEMIESSDDDIETLIKKVCRPRGTTERAVEFLEKKNFAQAVGDAMLACTKRTAELEKEADAE